MFHAAATVGFDEKLRKTVAVNVRATRDLLFIAQQMKRLKSFVQVSTAFSNCTNSVIEEKIYPPSMSYHHVIEIVEFLDDCLLENLTA